MGWRRFTYERAQTDLMPDPAPDSGDATASSGQGVAGARGIPEGLPEQLVAAAFPQNGLHRPSMVSTQAPTNPPRAEHRECTMGT
jgi:hypothetical protein